jgi:hypothetical protein
MRRLNARPRRSAGLLILALSAIVLLAVPAMAAARCHGGDPGSQGNADWHGGWHHHGHHGHHGQFPPSQSGTITSFDTESGELVITLTNGKTVSGTVTEETEIEGGTTESLITGAAVDGARLHLEEGGAVYDEVDLAPAPES